MKNTVCRPNRDKRISMRVTEEECAVIDYAATLVSKNRSAFIIDNAVHEAQNIILTQSIIHLDDAHYQEFIEQLEAPLQNVEGRKRLMNLKPDWK
ncbi:DUF1778 domain-containing protein [Citrobacter sp. TBCS-14]|uniref:type II toxin-antitoxin system TacA family antitoxin n=1 Tax=Citrobacter sp. TBCS-14 TaxID=2576409 RepID=UPI00113CA887|nr:DUF1778 domain-containing protein [Citrobacter sp. TBCS-14]TKU68815.1 DUF1778 domain-containing protein [Citrobacter sp. TBCS-14]